MKTINVGIVGCGMISECYLTFMYGIYPWMNVAACADLNPERAKERAAQYPGMTPMTVDELLADPGIDLVLNLTIPAAHFDISMRAVKAGKHVYSEKPITVTREECVQLMDAAKQHGVRLGCAPDSFLGGGIQTVIRLIDEGAVGDVLGISGFMLYHGPEFYHPDGEFYYKAGGGPLYDMAPYYLNAFIGMIGPVKAVCGSAVRGFDTRYFGTGDNIPAEKRGKPIPVEIPTHVNAILEFASGAVGTLATSWDVWGTMTPKVEIHGTRGSIAFTDPNSWGGEVKLIHENEMEIVYSPRPDEWTGISLTHQTNMGRGIGVADMAQAILTGRPHRASGEMALHVLDIMQSIYESAEQRRWLDLKTTCTRPAPMKPWRRVGEID